MPDWPPGRPVSRSNCLIPEIPPNGVLTIVIRSNCQSPTVWLPQTWESKVVHHVIVRAKWPDGPDDGRLWCHVDGLCPGMINAGPLRDRPLRSNAGFHYTAIGSPQTDQTEIAFYVPRQTLREVTTARDSNVAEYPARSTKHAFGGIRIHKPATIYSLSCTCIFVKMDVV